MQSIAPARILQVISIVLLIVGISLIALGSSLLGPVNRAPDTEEGLVFLEELRVSMQAELDRLATPTPQAEDTPTPQGANTPVPQTEATSAPEAGTGEPQDGDEAVPAEEEGITIDTVISYYRFVAGIQIAEGVLHLLCGLVGMLCYARATQAKRVIAIILGFLSLLYNVVRLFIGSELLNVIASALLPAVFLYAAFKFHVDRPAKRPTGALRPPRL